MPDAAECAEGAEAAILLPPRATACDAGGMPSPQFEPPFDQLLATAERVARERPEVDPEMAREVFEEAATLLYNGLAVEGLDEHDAHLVVAGLCEDLVAPDPGAAVRRHAQAALDDPAGLHDPKGVAAAYEVSARILQL